ncbi:MAG: hypothetical protein KGH87_09415 [Thaumarchaeota archaeon]|nr:hypothetical protein [Nitrososphaerota archaeon]
MPKLQKIEGKVETCPSNGCGCKIVCRMTKPKEGSAFAPKLQWQNEDGTPHYGTSDGVNFTCNKPGEKTESTSSKETVASPAKSSSLMEFILNYDFTELKEPEQEAVEKKAKKLFEQKLIVTKVAMETFASAGFDNVASVGQVLTLINQ